MSEKILIRKLYQIMRSITVHQVCQFDQCLFSDKLHTDKKEIGGTFILKYVGIGSQIMYKVVCFPLDVK